MNMIEKIKLILYECIFMFVWIWLERDECICGGMVFYFKKCCLLLMGIIKGKIERIVKIDLR